MSRDNLIIEADILVIGGGSCGQHGGRRGLTSVQVNEGVKTSFSRFYAAGNPCHGCLETFEPSFCLRGNCYGLF
jgi:hypothetical protein